MSVIPVFDPNFQRIISFYLFECPVRTRRRITKAERDPDDPQAKYKYIFKRVSQRGLTFADRGLDGPKLNSLRAAMTRLTDAKLIVTEQEVTAPEFNEYIIIQRNDNTSVTEGYFYCIRNAFAHGSFDVASGKYILQNNSGGKIRGLAVLREETLLSWIDLVNSPIEEIRRAGKNKKREL